MEQYEEQVAGRPERTLALRSSSRKSLSCNRSSLSLNTLTAASDTHSPHSTLHHHVAGAFSSAMVSTGKLKQKQHIFFFFHVCLIVLLFEYDFI